MLAGFSLFASMALTSAAPAWSMAQAVLTMLVPALLAHRLAAAAALLLTGLISYEACAGQAAAEFAAGLVHAAAASVWLGAIANTTKCKSIWPARPMRHIAIDKAADDLLCSVRIRAGAHSATARRLPLRRLPRLLSVNF